MLDGSGGVGMFLARPPRERMPNEPKTLLDRILKPILASRFLTVSALIHLLIIVLFGGKALFNRYVEPPDFTGDETVSADVGPGPPPDTPDTTLPPPPSVAAPPPPTSAPPTNFSAITTMNTAAASFDLQAPTIEPPTINQNPTASAPQTFTPGTGPVLPGAMSARSSGQRGTAGQKYGEKSEAEQAVQRALLWLQQQQHSDGTWGSAKYHTAFTGLALLCYLGHGDTPQTSREFSVVVSNAIGALVNESAMHQGRLGGASDFNWLQESVYEHAIATYAACEAYTMTKDPRLLPVVKQAVNYIVQGQRSDGGWAYRYDLGPDPDGAGMVKSDLSVSGWQVQALKAAHLTGIPGMEAMVHPVLDKAMGNVDRVFDKKSGLFGYRVASDAGGHVLTGVGCLCKLFWLGRADSEVREGLKNITSNALDYNGKDAILYAWYYNTQACFQAQGGAWAWWRQRFQEQLLNNQSADGSWPVPPKIDKGWFEANPSGDGPVYRTTMCCLMLEVFYRYLPTSSDTALSGGVEGL